MPTPKPPRHPHAFNRAYGYKRPTAPSRLSLFSPPAHLMGAANLPGSVDLRPKCPSVYDQLSLGSCTSNALAGLVQFLQMKQGVPSWIPSRLMIYWGERDIEGSIPEDAGANADDGMTILETKGVCPEAEWPYDVGQFAVDPPVSAWRDALANKLLGPMQIADGDGQGIKSCLAGSFPVTIGFDVYPAMESKAVGTSGFLTMPGPGEQSIGGHEVLIVGYDDALVYLGLTGWFLCRNSWSPGWGLNGYFWMPYAYALNTQLCSGLRSATGVTPATPVVPTPPPTPTPATSSPVAALAFGGRGQITVDWSTTPINVALDDPAKYNVFKG